MEINDQVGHEKHVYIYIYILYLDGGKYSSDIINWTPLILENVQAYTPISINYTRQ